MRCRFGHHSRLFWGDLVFRAICPGYPKKISHNQSLTNSVFSQAVCFSCSPSRFDPAVLGDAECACQFACSPGLVGVQINRRRRHRGMAQVVPNRRQGRSVSQRVGRVRMTHPVRAGSPQFFGQCGVDGSEICRALTEESLDHRPQPRTRAKVRRLPALHRAPHYGGPGTIHLAKVNSDPN